MLSRISDHYPVWTYPTEVRAGGPQYAAGQPWRKVAQWKSKAHESDIVRDDRTYDLTVEGRLRGMVVAARHIELHMMVNDTGSLIEVEMRDLPASVIDTRYGIRSTFRWFSGKSNFIAPVLDHEFALVTLEWDKSDDIVFWPNEYIAAVSSTYHYLPGPCPRISLGGSWVFMRGQFEPFRNKAVPYVDDVRALGVANLDRPSGMFPVESQPVEGRVEIKSRDGVVPPMHFVVPVSSEKPDASSTPTR